MLRFLLTSLLLSKSFAWMPPNHDRTTTTTTTTTLRRATRVVLRLDKSSESMSDIKTNKIPCWQDIYDEDCTMDSIFSASFVPSEWIKQLPCGSGMEDCDFPEDVLLPEIRPESHSEINVMEFLNIKRPADSKLIP